MKKEYNVSAIAKGISILEYLKTKKTASFTNIHSDLGLAKSSVYQLLKTFERYNFVTQMQDGDYALGLKLFELGYEVGQNIDWRGVVQPFLKELSKKTGFSIHLSILTETLRAICLEKIEGEVYTMQLTRIGSPLPMHSSASAKVLLAWQPEEVLREAIKNITFERFTEYTILNKEDYLQELARVKKQGYAFDNRESEIMFRGAGAPVFGRSGKIVAAVSMGATIMEFPEERMDEISSLLTSACAKISSQMTI